MNEDPRKAGREPTPPSGDDDAFMFRMAMLLFVIAGLVIAVIAISGGGFE